MSKQNGEKKEPEITCDFSKVSRRWYKQWSQLGLEIVQLGSALQEPEPDHFDDKHQELDYRRATAESAAELQRLMDSQEDMMAQVVTGVPPEWLTDDAPADIDWTKPDSFVDCIQLGYDNQLREQVSEMARDYRKN